MKITIARKLQNSLLEYETLKIIDTDRLSSSQYKNLTLLYRKLVDFKSTTFGEMIILPFNITEKELEL